MAGAPKKPRHGLLRRFAPRNDISNLLNRMAKISLPLSLSAFALACGVAPAPSRAQEGERRHPPALPLRPPKPAPASDAPSRAARRTPIVEVVERDAPTVVNISTEQRVENNPFRNDPFWGFFGGFPGFPGPGGEPQGDGEGFVQNSLGSGVIVDPAGYILTNNHVISGASRIQVTTVERKTYTAEVVGADAGSDLALLKIEDGHGHFPAVKIGASSDLMIGETVIAIGNPYGLGHTVSAGILSATGRTLPGEGKSFSDFLQTDAPINPGNSGGPLVNLNGELIGINSAILAKGQSIGFAIPVDRAKKIMRDLRERGAVRPLWLGVQVSEQNERQRAKSGRDGLLVTRVYASGAAADSGLKPGDLITKLAGRELVGGPDFETALATASPGEALPFAALRRGQPLTGTLRAAAAPKAVSDGLLAELTGLAVGDGNGAAEIRRVSDHTPAAEIGLKPGDFILMINGRQTPTAAAVKESVAAALGQEGISVVVQRGRGRYRITLPLGI